MADKTNPDGRREPPYSLQGRLGPRLHTFHWPTQGNPNQHDWQLWKEGLKKIMTDNNQWAPLEQWKKVDNPTWFYSPTELCLFQKSDSSWLCYDRTHCTTCQHYFQIIGTSPAKSALHTAYVSRFNNYWMCHGYTPTPFMQASHPTSLAQHISRQAIEKSWSMKNFVSTDNEEVIADTLHSETAIAVCNGSYKQGKGSLAWVKEGVTSRGRIKGWNWVPGSTHVQSSYRSELSGLLGIVSFIVELCTFHDIKYGSITIACDNFSALTNSLEDDSYTSIWDPDHDLIVAIKNKILELPITLLYHHAWGHQDDKKSDCKLDRWKKLNIEMDDLAKQTL